ISTTRPRGRPPTPSAISSPSEPEEMVSISIERSFLPSRITEPLPNWRSIWDSAADRALVLSMEDPSTIRRAVAADMVVLLMAGIRERDKGNNGSVRIAGTLYHVCSLFAICSFGPTWRVYLNLLGFIPNPAASNLHACVRYWT